MLSRGKDKYSDCASHWYKVVGFKYDTDDLSFWSYDVSGYKSVNKRAFYVFNTSSDLPLVPHGPQTSNILLQDIFEDPSF